MRGQIWNESIRLVTERVLIPNPAGISKNKKVDAITESLVPSSSAAENCVDSS
jgi:hypothetical protein